VFGGAALAAVAGLARRPGGATWAELYGVSVLCGVGFTFSLFLGGLAFAGSDPALLAQMKLGVICGSLLSGACGAVALGWAAARRRSMATEPIPYDETT
jgi:NhaA family Na+:H+ antiporter